MSVDNPIHSLTKLPKSAEGHQALKEARYADAESIYRELAAEIRKQFGEDHIEMAIALTGLVAALEGQGKISEAIPYEELASQILLRQTRRDR